MKLRGHSTILVFVTIAWGLFWLIGLPDYYQQYATVSMLIFDIIILILLTGFLYWLLKRTPQQFRSSLSFWLAFYITIPLFIYDYLYCGIYLGNGLTFVSTYWYLSVYYIIPWILCPALIIILNHQRSDSNKC